MLLGTGGAILGGVVGAIIWAGVMYFAHMEAAFVAWIIGGLVGGSSVALGGRGGIMGLICGLIAAVSIFGGRAVGYQFIDRDTMSAMEDEMYGVNEDEDRDLYEEIMEDARLFRNVKGDDATKAFMVARDYTLASNPARVSDDEMYDFLAEYEYNLRSWGESPPTYEEWYVQWYELEADDEEYPGEESQSGIGRLLGSIGLFDIIFIFLGVSTAFQMVASRRQGNMYS